MEKLNRIKVILAEKDMKVHEFADGMGLSREYVSRWINNKSQPSLKQLFEIGKLLNVSVCDLINNNA